MASALHLAIRLLHVLSLSVLFGGAALIWLSARRASDRARLGATRTLALEYEWVFWGGVGVLVATGVGNLGALAPAVPSPDAAWGLTLATKLFAVVVLLLGSVVRTTMVEALDDIANRQRHVRRRLRVGYAATTLWLAGLVVFGVVLAHG